MNALKRKVEKLMEEWCKEALGTKYYRERAVCAEITKKFPFRKTLTVYTDRPGYLIGYHGTIINKYEPMFKEIGIHSLRLKEMPTHGLKICVQKGT